MESKHQLQGRTRSFALQIVRFWGRLEKDEVNRIMGRQLLRSGTSVGANYRAACRARSAADFRAKLGIVEEEADECLYWLDLLRETNPGIGDVIAELDNEANQILAMVVASIKTSKTGS